MKKVMTFWTLGLALSLSILSCNNDDDIDDPNDNVGPSTLQAELSADARFSILVDALGQTGLDSTLDAPGTYTLFAPTNDAFQQLFSDFGVADLQEALNQLGSDAIRNLLLYHVLPTKQLSGDLSAQFYKTLALNTNGNALDFYLDPAASNGVLINDVSLVEDPNIQASNGVAHAVSQVLRPQNVFQLISHDTELQSLQTALTLDQSNLDLILRPDTAQYTLFAPNNAAFDTLVANTANVNNLADLVAALSPQQLTQILRYHVVPTELQAADLSIGSLNTLSASSGTTLQLTVNITGNRVTLSDRSSATADAEVIATDITGTNGVIHRIDQVLLTQ